jgi:peptide deformylase
MCNVLKVVQVGHPVLRQTARALTGREIQAPETVRLIEDMRETMRDAPGVGLAAPQVGRSLQIVVIEDRPTYVDRLSEEERQARGRTPVPFQVLINPRLTFVDRAPLWFFEGCLSFTDFMMVVPRARAVRVDALDHHGHAFSLTAEGWPARILQHEIDHLHGVLCVDRMSSRTLTSTRNHAEHWQHHPVDSILRTVGNTLETDHVLPPPGGAPAEARDTDPNDARAIPQRPGQDPLQDPRHVTEDEG